MKRFQMFLSIAGLAAIGMLAGCGGSRSASTATPAGEEPELDATALDQYKYFMSEAGLAQSEQRLDDALENYLSAAQVLEETGEVSVKQADAHFQAAEIAYQRFDKELAIQQYEKAVGLYLRFPGNSQSKAAVAYTNMGVVYKEMHDKARARTCWQQALEVYRNAPESSQNAGHIEKINQNIRDLDEGF